MPGNQELYILGNGPSLKVTLEEKRALLEKRTVLCVNNFAVSPYFEQLKPSYYVLNAPEYFMVAPPTIAHVDMRESLFGIFVEKVKWEMVLFVPVIARKTDFWQNYLRKNPHIHIEFYNSTPVEGPKSFCHFLFKKELGMPRPHNVLVPSIFLGINMGYKAILLFGADHSWHEEIKVDEHNQMTVNHEHFYDKKDQRGKMHKLDGTAYHIHDVFRKLYLAFQGYFILASYAKEQGVSIRNASVRSYIDAFEKVQV